MYGQVGGCQFLPVVSARTTYARRDALKESTFILSAGHAVTTSLLHSRREPLQGSQKPFHFIKRQSKLQQPLGTGRNCETRDPCSLRQQFWWELDPLWQLVEGVEADRGSLGARAWLGRKKPSCIRLPVRNPSTQPLRPPNSQVDHQAPRAVISSPSHHNSSNNNNTSTPTHHLRFSRPPRFSFGDRAEPTHGTSFAFLVSQPAAPVPAACAIWRGLTRSPSINRKPPRGPRSAGLRIHSKATGLASRSTPLYLPSILTIFTRGMLFWILKSARSYFSPSSPPWRFPALTHFSGFRPSAQVRWGNRAVGCEPTPTSTGRINFGNPFHF